MTKQQSIQWLWSNFGLKAYNEQTVPDDAKLPYITYSVATGSIDSVVNLTASVWYEGRSWKEANKKTNDIAEFLGTLKPVKIDGGYAYFTQGNPFAQTMGDDTSDLVRRVYINVQAEFLTAY